MSPHLFGKMLQKVKWLFGSTPELIIWCWNNFYIECWIASSLNYLQLRKYDLICHPWRRRTTQTAANAWWDSLICLQMHLSLIKTVLLTTNIKYWFPYNLSQEVLRLLVFHGMALQLLLNCSFKANFILIMQDTVFNSVQYILPQFSILLITTFVALAAPDEFQGQCYSRLTIGGTILPVTFEISHGIMENKSRRLSVGYCVKVKMIVKWR